MTQNTKISDTEMLDVDVRFILANERTLLAWIRTGLALQAGGIALTQLHKTDGAALIGICILALGSVVAIAGYTRFRAADKAIRAHRLPQPGKGPLLQVVGVVVIGFVLGITQLLDLF